MDDYYYVNFISKGGLMMNILMTGGTGFIGEALVTQLVSEGNHIYVLTRHPKKYQDTPNISYISYQFPINRLPFIHAIINLAGESLFGYWTAKKKENIMTSRIEATNALIKMMAKMEDKPHTFISASAIGYYGTSESLIFTEETEDAGNDFLANVTMNWERTAGIAEDFSIRTVYTRFGLVLAKNGGSLPLMALPVQYFIGGKIGRGTQWISWIHLEDCVRLIVYSLHNKSIQGPVNVTAPHPQRNKEFIKTLASVKGRPSFFPTPGFLLNVALGEMSTLITDGQYVLPKKALDSEFEFNYEYLEDALRDIYR